MVPAQSPEELGAFWKNVGGGIATEEEKTDELKKAGYSPVASFRLPEAGWLQHFYDPMLRIVAQYREQYGNGPALAGELDELDAEAAMYRKYSLYYGYTFFIGKKA